MRHQPHNAIVLFSEPVKRVEGNFAVTTITRKSMQRCDWVSQTPFILPIMITSGRTRKPIGRKLFEMICLEGQQAGLSFRITVL